MPFSFHVLARVPLLPLLVAQAIAVRARARFLPEPPGPRCGQSGAGPLIRLLIVGDSSAAGVGAPSQDVALSGQLVAHLARQYRIEWQLEARTGATTQATVASLSQLPPARFDIAVVALGVNDVTRRVSRRQWIAQRRSLHALLRQRFGVTRICASGVPPMGQFPLLPQPLRWFLGQQAARFDAALVDLLANDSGATHVPIDLPHDAKYVAPDGYHPTPAAYAVWASLLAHSIARSGV